MNNSDETLKKPLENDAVLQAIAELSKTVVELSNKFDKLENKFDKLENFVTVQFDAVQYTCEINALDCGERTADGRS